MSPILKDQMETAQFLIVPQSGCSSGLTGPGLHMRAFLGLEHVEETRFSSGLMLAPRTLESDSGNRTKHIHLTTLK